MRKSFSPHSRELAVRSWPNSGATIRDGDHRRHTHTGQSVEISSLIPLKYGCTRCILVGGQIPPQSCSGFFSDVSGADPLQLPPTVKSTIAAGAGYDQSLFVRIMQQDRAAVNLLSYLSSFHRQESKELTLDRCTVFSTGCTPTSPSSPPPTSTTASSKTDRAWQTKAKRPGTRALCSRRTQIGRAHV